MENFIDEKRNDYFSYLRGLDLQQLLVEIEAYLLEYRTSLGLSEDLTFGLELEYESLSKHEVDDFVICNLPFWVSKNDLSLRSGGEVSSAILKDSKECWSKLQMLCAFLTKEKAKTTGVAGGHVHIGSNILGVDINAWRIFLKTYAAYENILFRFGYGDKVNARLNIAECARPERDGLLFNHLYDLNTAQTIKEIFFSFPTEDRNIALNLRNVSFGLEDKPQNTVEYRLFNATTNEVVWQNNVNAAAKLMTSAKEGAMDEEFIDYKLRQMLLKTPSKYSYNCVELLSALEFVDIIFANNLDKIYFLKQYLKGYQEHYGNSLVKAKKFTK